MGFDLVVWFQNFTAKALLPTAMILIDRTIIIDLKRRRWKSMTGHDYTH